MSVFIIIRWNGLFLDPRMNKVFKLSIIGDLRSVNRGFALMRTEEDDQASTYCRTYTWDEENRLVGFDT